jgi:amino acid transporter
MGTVIYEASPFQAFLGSLGTILLLLVIGVVGIGIAIFRRNQRRSTRILTGALGVFLLIVSCVLAAFTLYSFSSGARTVAMRLDNKTIANDNCGDNGETCTRYVLSATTSTNAYDFDVPQSVYQKAKLKVCYQISYYQNMGFYGLWQNTGSYQRIDNITSIGLADPTACQ